MRDIIKARGTCTFYDPSKKIKEGRGRPAKIVDFTPQAEVVYNATESGVSLGNTVVMLNQWRRVRRLKPMRYGALQGFVSRSPVMKLGKTLTIKSGNDDQGSDWATSRLSLLNNCSVNCLKGSAFQEGVFNLMDGDIDQTALEKPIYPGGKAFGDEVGVTMHHLLNLTHPLSPSPASSRLHPWYLSKV